MVQHLVEMRLQGPHLMRVSCSAAPHPALCSACMCRRVCLYQFLSVPRHRFMNPHVQGFFRTVLTYAVCCCICPGVAVVGAAAAPGAGAAVVEEEKDELDGAGQQKKKRKSGATFARSDWVKNTAYQFASRYGNAWVSKDASADLGEDGQKCVFTITPGSTDGDKGVVHCRLCQDFCADLRKLPHRPQETAFSKDGCKTGKTSELNGHLQSGFHRKAAELADPKPKPVTGTVPGSFDAVLLGAYLEVKVLHNMIKITYLICMAALPLSLFGVLCLMVRACGSAAMSVGKYLNRAMCKELLEAISEVVEDQLIDELSKSPTFGVAIDESTDVSSEKKLMVYISYLKNFEVHVKYLTLVKLPHSTAECNFDTLLSVLKDRGVDTKRITGFSSDGCNVMFGCNTGVATRLKEQQPYLLAAHCIAHKLALASADAAKSVSFVNNDLHKFFGNSPKKFDKLAAWQKELEQPSLKVLRFHAVRWLSRHNCVHNITRQYLAILSALEAESASDATAKALYDKMRVMKVALTLHHCCDILGRLSSLSKVFQSRTLIFSCIKGKVDGTTAWLKSTHQSDGNSVYGAAYEAFKAALEEEGSKYAEHMLGTVEDAEAAAVSLAAEFADAISMRHA